MVFTQAGLTIEYQKQILKKPIKGSPADLQTLIRLSEGQHMFGQFYTINGTCLKGSDVDGKTMFFSAMKCQRFDT